jgi:hypothetical protein
VWEVATARPLIDLPNEWTIKKGFSPDGRLVALADPDRFVVVDLATRKVVLERPAPEYLRQHGYFAFGGITFSPDGRTLATGLEDGTILFWDVPITTSGTGEKIKEEAEIWDDLASENPANAYASIWRLRQHPEEAIQLLTKRLPPAKPSTDADLRALIGKLDSDQFDEREAASKQLKEAGRGAEDALRRTLKNSPSPEQKRRIAELLEFPELDTKVSKGDDLRAIRVVAVVEAIRTPAARQLLEEWAKGRAGERLTEEAARAVMRMKCANP